MCCICFETVTLANAQTDPSGIKWDVHWWCAIQDDLDFYRRAPSNHQSYTTGYMTRTFV